MNRIAAVVAGLSLAFVGTSATIAGSGTLYVAMPEHGGNDCVECGTPDEPYATIKFAIQNAHPGYTISINPGIYPENDLRILDKPLTIQSSNGDRDSVVIDGGGHHRVFYINGSATNGTSIRDLTIRNGHTWTDGDGAEWNGGGIWCNSDIIVSNCKIMDCHAYQSGGGIACYNSSPTISGCTIEGNIAYDDASEGGGGGIYCYQSSPTISGCTIEGNIAYDDASEGGGGGIYCYQSSPTISGGKICGNHPDQHSGCHLSSTPGTTIAPTCPKPPGDIDGDGDVDADDLNALHDELGIELTDVNNNGCVDIDDLLYVIEDWGEGCSGL